MTENGKEESKSSEPKKLHSTSTSPLVFISHDSRDAELAEAFSKLLRSVSGGMLKSFRSSDKKGTEGIDFGDDWYKRVISKIDSASDVVCLFTKRSVGRPWILYEAGFAKGKLDIPVYGIALGIPLRHVAVGPFYQFQNCDDTEEAMIKLITQLSKRFPALDLDEDVVKSQVGAFKKTTEELITNLSDATETTTEEEDDNSVATLLEEMKVMFRDLPSRVEDHLADVVIVPDQRRRRRFNPVMAQELMHMTDRTGNPIGILLFASLVGQEAPWLHEIAVEAYRAATLGTQKAVQQTLMTLHHAAEFLIGSPELFAIRSKEADFIAREGPRMLEKMIKFCLRGHKSAFERNT